MDDEGAIGVLKEQNRAFTRRRLIDAARVVFAAREYPDATVDEISRTVGTSPATFYAHFSGKGEIAGALLDDVLPFAVARHQELDTLLQRGGPALREQLQAWLSDWLGYWLDDADLNRTLYQAVMVDPVAQRHLLRACETMIDALQWYLGSKPEPEREAARIRLLILEMMTQPVLASASGARLPVGNADAVTVLADMWFDALAVPAQAGQPS